jgi:uncharacterized membrane protein YtjA (UPF0391 family)
MIGWALTFLLIVVFLVLFLISLIAGRRTPVA